MRPVATNPAGPERGSEKTLTWQRNRKCCSKTIRWNIGRIAQLAFEPTARPPVVAAARRRGWADKPRHSGSRRLTHELVLEHSVEIDASAAFVWNYRTDVATWSDPPATFLLNGPFIEGTKGTTLIPGQDPLTWWIRDVDAGSSFVIEMPLDRATLRFEWHVVPISEQRTKLTQRIVLSGRNAKAYREQIRTGIGPTLGAGMARMSADIAAAERTRQTPG
jgi:hypothetical protein